MNQLRNLQQVIVCLILAVILSAPAEAKVKPGALFADNMVLQQQTKALPIWGTASVGKQISIKTSWDNRTYSTTADHQGKWRTTISTPQAGGPYTITLNDGEALILRNILIGEVWLCGGQSNMEMPMRGFNVQPLEKGTHMDIMTSSNDALRLFNIKRLATLTPQQETDGKWLPATPANVAPFSATAYYFGSLLQQSLGIPVGVITTYWGASSIEAWMSREMLAEFSDIRYPETLNGIERKQQVPTALHNGMLNPIRGAAIKGMIWYQAESNIDNISQYANRFGKFITSMRKDWNIGEFPFYYCQIAPYQYYQKNSAFLREAQLQVESSTPNVGMAVLLDAGERACIHPQKKKTAGQRLALQALVRTYGLEGMPGQSPVYKDMTIQNDTVVLSFDRAPMGLTSYYKPITLFTVAGKDQVFYPAKAWIKVNKVYLISDKVSQPIAARYAFNNWVEAELYGVEGLPVSSFRTDTFDDPSLGK